MLWPKNPLLLFHMLPLFSELICLNFAEWQCDQSFHLSTIHQFNFLGKQLSVHAGVFSSILSGVRHFSGFTRNSAYSWSSSIVSGCIDEPLWMMFRLSLTDINVLLFGLAQLILQTSVNWLLRAISLHACCSFAFHLTCKVEHPAGLLDGNSCTNFLGESVFI